MTELLMMAFDAFARSRSSPARCCFVLALLAGNGNSYLQQAGIDSVKAAVAAYRAALGSLDPSKVDPLCAAMPT
jgi:hypothetical protein